MQSYFITGTDTGVGKTALTATLLACMRRQGLNAAPMKPVQTGCTKQNRALRAPDLDLCLRLAELDTNDATYHHMAPYLFEPACSPHLAAREARLPIQIDLILEAYRKLVRKYDPILVEGAGGVLVPLDETRTMLDLMLALDLPILIAARPGLGTINHTLLTLQCLRKAKLTVAGVAFVESAPSERGAIETDNPETIAKFGKTPILGTLPHTPNLETATTLPDPLAKAGDSILERLLR